MREKKKTSLKIIFLSLLALLVIGGSIGYVVYHNFMKTANQETKENKVDKSKNDKQEENKDTEIGEQKVDVEGEESVNIDNDKTIDSDSKNNQNNSSLNNKPEIDTNTTSQNNSSANNKTEQIPPANNNTSKQEPPKEEIPSCTPKKFDMNFVRADFSSFGECVSKGDQYKAAGYGYFCDNYQDDCGTTYYMLTIYERNTGIEYDFHTIPLP